MKFKPVPFMDEMVNAIDEGIKIVTRRPVRDASLSKPNSRAPWFSGTGF